MNRLIFILAFVGAALTGVAQVNVSGTVVEEGSNEPLTGASVILRDGSNLTPNQYILLFFCLFSRRYGARTLRHKAKGIIKNL